MSELDPPAPSIAQRAAAAKKATNEIKELRAKMQVQEALNHRNGPLTTAIHDLPINSEVLVWREGNARKTGSWKGPFKLLEVSGETCILQLPHGPTKFRTTAVKPFYSDDSTSLDEPNLPTIPQDKEVELDIEPEVRRHTTIEVEVPSPHTTGEPEPVRRRRGRPRKNALPAQTVADISIYLQTDQFKESRQKEIDGLLEKGVFATVPLSTVPNGIRIFNSRFVDEVKNAGTSTAFEKSRLVVQAYNDAEKELVLTQSPTIQRVSQRLILALTATLIGSGKNLYLRDISQAYVQSDTELCRDLYIKPPIELEIAHNMVLKVIKPLYGIPEAGNH